MSAISFEKHLPRLFLEQLDRHDEAKPFTLRLPAAVMMTDVSGFSALALELTREGAHGVEKLRGILDDYFGSLGAVVARHGGDISTFAGDAVIAVWPAHGDMPAAARLAAQCALGIQQEARGWSRGRHLNLTQRIAVACGEILICKLGGVNRKWLNVFAGQPVVDAGRACDVTTPGEVLLTPAVRDHLRADAATSVRDDGYARLDRLDGSVPAGVSSAERPPSALEPDRLASYLPDVLVRRAKSGQDEWLEEFRVVTAMFVKLDNIDFTRAEGPDALQGLTCAIQDVVHRYGGAMPYVQMDDKGLNFVIAFGIPTAAYEDDAVRALTAGLGVQNALRQLGVRPSIGIATGILFCGECGAQQRRQYSMIGPAINFAARLAGASTDDLLSDEDTAKAAGDKLSFTVAHNVRPKHADATVLALRPLKREKAPDTGRFGAMVGRADELQRLVGLLERAREGNAARLLISGEPGIGKSRLLRELRDAALSRGMGAVEGDARSIEANTPYFVWREGLAQLLARLARPGEAGRETLRRHFHGEPQLLQWAPLLNDILPLAIEETGLTNEIRGAARASSIHALLLALFKRACADAPMLLIIDDLQWIDALSAQALTMLAERLPELSLVVGSRPPEEGSGTAATEFCQSVALQKLSLGALNQAQTAEVIGHLCGLASVPDELSQLIQRRSDGNPFYIQQLTLELRESGHIEIVGGRCNLRKDIAERVANALPGTLRGVITSRVDRLGDDEQLVLKVASVFGRVFSEAGLSAIYPIAQQGKRIVEVLLGLLGSNLLTRETADGEPGYAFAHALVQEAVYELLPMAQRKRQHGRIADWLEEQHGDAIAGFFGVLANHCMLAEEFPRALNHLEGGALTAIRHSSYREAISNIEKAQRVASERQLDPDPLRRARWHTLLGDSHHELSEYKQAEQHYFTVLALLQRPFATGQLSQIGGVLANLARLMAAPAATPSAASTDAAAGGAPCLIAHAYSRLGEICYHKNKPLTLLQLTLMSFHAASKSKSIPEMSAAHGALAIAFGQAGLAGAARRYAQRAIDLAEARPSDVNAVAYAHLLAMVYASSRCDWPLLDASGSRAEALYSDLGDAFRIASAQALQLTGAIQRGQYQRAQAILDKMAPTIASGADARVAGWALDSKLQMAIACGQVARADIEARMSAAANVESLVDRLMSCGTVASAWLRLGETEQAMKSAAQGVELLLGQTPVAGAGYIYGPLGIVEALLAGWALQAPGAGPHALKTGRACAMLNTYTQQVPSTRPRGYFLLARHAELKGSKRQATSLWRKAAAAAQAQSMPYDQAAALLALGQRLPAGNPELAQAREIFASLRVPEPAIFQPTGST